MTKISLLSVFILLWVIPSFAQTVVNADKNYVTPLKSTMVSVTADAVLNGKPEANDVNRENYHRAVTVGNESENKSMQPPVVEITVAAYPHNLFSGHTTVRKEAITVTPQNSSAVNKATPAIIEIVVPAVKQ